MEQKTKKREWVKTVAIIFLSVLLVLTFFSKTIMNRSLPEVSTVSVSSGTINTKIRGTGSISANETYDVTIGQARKVQSVVARVGDEIKTGDTLFVLDPAESTELQAARDQLASMELSYQQALISAGNADAQENRTLQKAREAYNEALAIYNMYSKEDPSQLKIKESAAQASLKALQRAYEEAQEAVTEAQNSEEYAEYSANLAKVEGKISELEGNIEAYQKKLEDLLSADSTEPKRTVAVIQKELQSVSADLEAATNRKTQAEKELSAAQDELSKAQTQLATDEVTYDDDYRALEVIAAYPEESLDDATLLIRMQTFSANTDLLKNAMIRAGEKEEDITPERLTQLCNAFQTIFADQTRISTAEDTIQKLEAEIPELQKTIDSQTTQLENLRNELTEMQNSNLSAQQKLQKQVDELRNKIATAQYELASNRTAKTNLSTSIAQWDNYIKQLKEREKTAKQAVEDQNDVVQKYSDAMGAAATLESAQEQLEQLTFDASLGDPSYLTLQNQKDEIEKQKQTIAELEANADAIEVTAKVSGVISAVNITAGNTAQPETPLATITIKDRGYMVQIPATAEQARRVTVGDQATISNYYYGNITAELEKIVPDPKDPQKSRFLLFRLSGDGVEPGSNITLAIGQKSATYDAIVPSSAVRTDSNGTYVLVISEKRSPLGTRFIAKRADVNVIGSDDTSSAVTGVSNGDYVITTCTPGRTIEPGDQVRLVDES